MSVILQFNSLTHNETARKAMESYSEILQKAFECYQNLWEDYIKLQEKCGQCNVHSSSQMAVNTICTKTENEATSQLNANMQENNSIPLLELDTININPINFNSDTGTGLSDASESFHKNTEDNRAESPVFCRTFLKTGNNSVKKFVQSPKAVYDNSSSNMKIHNIEKVSSKCDNKLKISTTHHVETIFLPNGKRLKQSRLAFHPVKSNEKTTLSSNADKHKTNMLHNVEQNFIGDISIANATANTTVTENDSTNNTEISEDIIEVSPTQKTITSKIKRCLKFKKKIPVKHIKKISPNKCFDSNIVPEIIDNIDFELCPPLPKHTSMQIKDDNSLMNTAVNALKDKVNISYLSPIKMPNKTDIEIKKSIEAQKEDQLLINKVQNNKVIQNTNDFACEDETFYLPAEQAANRESIDNFNLDDTENKPPEKKTLLNKFNVLPKRKTDISEQLNMRCKANRAKLNGWDCWECREYYKHLSLSKEELQKRKNQCSRHRYKYERPKTPEGFWNPEFPETLSCTYRTE